MKKLIIPLLIAIAGSTAHAQTYELFLLRNERGVTMSVTNYGARIVSLKVPNKYGAIEDIVCGFDSLEHYNSFKQNYGATVGRYIGRILGASFELDGKIYRLDAESNGHCSHGGKPGFANRFWTLKDKKDNSLVLQYVSPDGESGFPGKLTLDVTMTLTEANELRIDYKATTDKPTVLNVSNHSFFNISADFRSDVLSQSMMVDGDSIAVYDANKCVTGELMSVDGTAFDFRPSQYEKFIGMHIDDDDPQLMVTGGYDHTYRLNHPGDISNVSARITDLKSGRVMEVLTTEPALHIYAGNGLKGNHIGKGGVVYQRRSAICFETMHFADSPNNPQWPSTVIRPDETYQSTTIYRFFTVE